jgi:hypothetical protein
MTNNIVGSSRIPHWLRDNLDPFRHRLLAASTPTLSVVWQPSR